MTHLPPVRVSLVSVPKLPGDKGLGPFWGDAAPHLMRHLLQVLHCHLHIVLLSHIVIRSRGNRRWSVGAACPDAYSNLFKHAFICQERALDDVNSKAMAQTACKPPKCQQMNLTQMPGRAASHLSANSNVTYCHRILQIVMQQHGLQWFT